MSTDRLTLRPARPGDASAVADTVVATVGGAVAGFVVVVGDEVEQVYVAAEHRGTGVAANGHDRAWLAVAVGNARARRFYEKRAWVDEGVFDYPAATDDGPLAVPCHRYVKPVR
jgi:GNAT superfamily N-acetyltransferase